MIKRITGLFILLWTIFGLSTAFAAYPLSPDFTWANNRVVTNTDLNNEFNKIYTMGLDPEHINDLSSTTTEHKATANPTSGLPLSAEEELQEIRYQIDQLTNNSTMGNFWYSIYSPEISGRQNIIPNAGFEWWSSGEDNVAPDGWSKKGTPTDVDRETGEADTFGGASAVEITSNGSSNEGITRTLSDLRASTTYTVTIRTKITSGTARVWTTGADTNIDQTSTSTSWATIEGFFTTDATPTNVVLNLGSDTATEVVFFDKIVVTQGIFPTAYANHNNYAALPGYYKNLVVESTSVTSVDIDADYLTVENTTGGFVMLAGVNETVDITVSSVGGLDVGADTEADNTSYAIWIIYNDTNGTINGVISSSFTTPSVPAAYTHKRLVSFIRNKNNNILQFHQRGKRYLYDQPRATSETTDVLNDGNSTGYDTVNCLDYTGAITITRTAIIMFYRDTAGAAPDGGTWVRPDGVTGEGNPIMYFIDEIAESDANEVFVNLTGANNSFEYKSEALDNDLSADVVGCILDI